LLLLKHILYNLNINQNSLVSIVHSSILIASKVYFRKKQYERFV
jgi:hypothetical protein